MNNITMTVDHIVTSEICGQIGEVLCLAVREQTHAAITAALTHEHDKWSRLISWIALLVFMLLICMSTDHRQKLAELIGLIALTITWIFVTVLTAGM